MKVWKTLFFMGVFTLGIGATAHGSEDLSKWTDNLRISGGLTGVFQGTSGNDDPLDVDATSRPKGAEDQTDFAYTFDLYLDSEFEPGHTLYVHIETGEGDGGNDNFSTAIVPNYDPYNTHSAAIGHQDVTISQAYYEGLFAGEKVIVDLGKMDIHSLTDENNFAGDETAQFMGGIFARLTGTLFAELNSYYAPGLRLFATPLPWLELTYVAANSNNDSLGKELFQAAQVNFKVAFGGREGNYRLYGIRDDRSYTDINDGSRKNNSGWGVSIDQQIVGNSGLFFRYGSQDDGIAENLYTSAISGGLSISGEMWNREGDALGLGWGVVQKNSDITVAYDKDATLIEAFYRIEIGERVTLTPDIQFFQNLPRVEKRDVMVAGVRGQIDF